jgi:hypothetical protein
MNGKNKRHAKDYLLEYKTKNIPNWQKFLIQHTIDNAGVISESAKEQIFKKLLEENQLNFDQKPEGTRENNKSISNEETEKEQEKENQNLILQKITHKKGVNALIKDQSIPFSPNCTIIYGLNATGKSGYFRIIHELAGGEQSKTILGNIYQPSEDLEVDVDFQLDAQDQPTYEWRNKEERGVYPFNQIRVFDSDYLPIFLEERESSFNVEPMGLNLFQIIINVIGDFKSRLDVLKQQEEDQKPDLELLIDLLHSQELKLIFSKTALNKEDKKLLEINQIFSDEESKKFEILNGQKQNLEKQNTEDSKKLYTQEKLEIDNLIKHLESLKNELGVISKEISESIQDYDNKKRIRDERKKEFEVLRNIPARDTEEWQIFIESAKDYEEKIDKRYFESKKYCIYCHQLLGDDALKLVQAYSQYLNDQSQQNFKSAEDKITELKEKLQIVKTSFVFSENLSNTLIDINKDKNKDTNIKDLVDQVLSNAEQQKITLKTALENIDTINPEYLLDLSSVEQEILDLSKQKQKELDDLQQSETDKKQIIDELEKDIHKLEDKQNVKKWKDKIDKYFSGCEKSHKYEGAIRAISTIGITNLSSKAHDEILTENIRKSFENELKALGEDIKVNLEKTGARKGKVRTRLKILGENIRDILSKGEQNAVGLALFLAEVKNQHDKNPIVFDDPVTSLDHEVRDSLGKRLIQLSENRQVIIFTHDLLFAHQLIKNGNEQNNDFSTHVIDRTSLGIGRVNINTSPKMSNLANLREKYNEAIKDYDNLDSDKREIALAGAFDYLRCSCECLIEEVLFAGTIQRYDDHVKVQNLEEAVLDKELALKIVELHGEISEKAMMHNQSDFQRQGLSPLKDFNYCKNKFEQLHNDLKEKKNENIKTRDEKKRTQKKDPKQNW